MRVALVQMPPHPRDTPPFEMALTTAILRKAGHQVDVFDLNNDIYHEAFKQRPYWKFQLTSHSAEPDVALSITERERFLRHAEKVLAARPDAVVFKAENALHNALTLGRLIKERWPSVPVLASGTATPDRSLIGEWKRLQDRTDEYGQPVVPFDYFILGEDDIVLPKVLEVLASGRAAELAKLFVVTGRIIDAMAGPHVAEMDDLPSYDFTDYDFMRYADPGTVRFTISRSCTQHCAFCQDWVLGRKYRTMSGERWFEEYRCQHDRHPRLAHFRHYDRLLNGDIAVLDRFCDLVTSRYQEPPVAWGGDFIIREEMEDALIAKMAKARCNSFGTGLESGSERVRAAMYKDFFSNETASRIFAGCRRHNIPVSLNIMIGLPTETREDFEESIRFVEGNAGNLAEIRLTSPTALIQPGTPLALNPGHFGLSSGEHEKWQSADGANDYAERVRRFEEFCRRALGLRGRGVRLAVNRRIVKNETAIDRLVEECLEGAPSQDRRGGRAASMRQLRKKIDLLGPWVHRYEFNGLSTRDAPSGPESGPFKLWEYAKARLGRDITGRTLIDIGCSDGWFAWQASRMGAAAVLGTDEDLACIRRAKFAAEVLGDARGKLDFKAINPYEVDHWARTDPTFPVRHFDAALLFEGLFHTIHPMLLLAKAMSVADTVFLTAFLDTRHEAPSLVWGPAHPSWGTRGYARPKWVPTRACLLQMLEHTGFSGVEELGSEDIAEGLRYALVAASVKKADEPVREEAYASRH